MQGLLASGAVTSTALLAKVSHRVDPDPRGKEDAPFLFHRRSCQDMLQRHGSGERGELGPSQCNHQPSLCLMWSCLENKCVDIHKVLKSCLAHSKCYINISYLITFTTK